MLGLFILFLLIARTVLMRGFQISVPGFSGRTRAGISVFVFLLLVLFLILLISLTLTVLML